MIEVVCKCSGVRDISVRIEDVDALAGWWVAVYHDDGDDERPVRRFQAASAADAQALAERDAPHRLIGSLRPGSDIRKGPKIRLVSIAFELYRNPHAEV